MIYRIEIHETETGKYLPQVWDGDVTTGAPLWEGSYYDDVDDAYTAARYEFDQRKEVDREKRVLARTEDHERAPLTYQQQAQDNGLSGAGWP